jgi:hypothetical protein
MDIQAKRNQFFADIITTAIEGGIGYWSVTLQYQYNGKPCVGELVEGVDTCATISPEDSNIIYGIDIDLIDKGIDAILGERVSISVATQEAIERAWAELDAGEIDADAADAIVQVGLFGKLVYG